MAFRDVTLSRYVTFDWFKRFTKGLISIEDDRCPGRLLTSNQIINFVQNKIRYYQWLNIREVANEDVISIGIYYSILSNELGMKRVSTT